LPLPAVSVEKTSSKAPPTPLGSNPPNAPR
jgi:hypothetical protein